MKSRILLGLIFSLAFSSIAAAANEPVTLTDAGRTYKLSNSKCTAVISKQTGDLSSLSFNGIETMGYGSGHSAGYWEQSPANAVASVTIDPAANDGARAEVSVKGAATGGVG